jgi:hypothetical protein
MNWMCSLKQARLSKGYQKFQRMFKCQCTKCGCKSCAVHIEYVDKKCFWFFNKRLYFIGFICLKCNAKWLHVYDIEQRVKRKG